MEVIRAFIPDLPEVFEPNATENFKTTLIDRFNKTYSEGTDFPDPAAGKCSKFDGHKKSSDYPLIRNVFEQYAEIKKIGVGAYG